MIFRQLFDPTSSTYSYLLGDSVSGEALLIDPVFEQARRDGHDVTIDQYPYAASSTTLDVMLPDWAVNPHALRRAGAARLPRASRRLRLR